MKYDPSWFVKKELYIESLRNDINSKPHPEIRKVFHEVLNFYEEHIDLLRVYKTTFDVKKKKKLKHKIKAAKAKFIQGLDSLQDLF